MTGSRASGPNLGAAIHALMHVPVPTNRSWKQQLSYVSSRHTGASTESLMSQLGVTERTLKIWQKGGRVPAKRNQAKLREMFGRFWEINHRRANPGNRMFRVHGEIYVSGRQRWSILVERLSGSQARDWERLRTTSDADISKDDGLVFVEALDIPPGPAYLKFTGGEYIMEFVDG